MAEKEKIRNNYNNYNCIPKLSPTYFYRNKTFLQLFEMKIKN